MKLYEVGNCKCTLEETEKGYYIVTAEWDGHTYKHRFGTKEKALEEILSYAEVDEF